jgi:hypothetical protein
MDWLTFEAGVLLGVVLSPAVLIYWIWLECHDHDDQHR